MNRVNLLKGLLAVTLIGMITLTQVAVAAETETPFADSAPVVGSLRWKEDCQEKIITLKDLQEIQKPILGYVYDLIQKENLCYTGTDMEVISILFKGLKRKGNEICEGTMSVQNQVISIGPCVMPEIHDDPYSLNISPCK